MEDLWAWMIRLCQVKRIYFKWSKFYISSFHGKHPSIIYASLCSRLWGVNADAQEVKVNFVQRWNVRKQSYFSGIQRLSTSTQ